VGDFLGFVIERTGFRGLFKFERKPLGSLDLGKGNYWMKVDKSVKVFCWSDFKQKFLLYM
jgi:hypothetical protein